MELTINLKEAHPTELTAIIALCLALGGKMPVDVSIEFDERPPAPPVPGNVPPPPPVDTSTATVVASPSVVPPPPTSAPAVPAGSMAVDLDADGVPWDERIHASTQTKTAQNRWTKRKKVNEVEYGRVFAELQERYAGHVPPPPPVTEGNVPPPPPPVTAEPESAPTAADSTDAENASVDTDFADFPAFVKAVSVFGMAYNELNDIAAAVVGPGTGFRDMKNYAAMWEEYYGQACLRNGVVPD